MVGQGGYSRVRVPFRQIVCIGTGTYYIYIAFYSPGAIARDVDHPLDVPLEREWFTVTPPLQKPPTGCCCLYI